MKVTGVADVTVTGGRVVWEDGKFNSTPGSGRYVSREPFGYTFERVKKYDDYRDPRKLMVDRSGAANSAPENKENSKSVKDIQEQLDLLKGTYEALNSRYAELQ